MAKRRRTESLCPVARAVDIVGDRWSLLIIRDVFDGTCRFSALQESLGIARNILADRLRALKQAGIIQTVPASDGSLYHDHVLTPMGASLFPVIVTLRQWGESHLFTRGEAPSKLVELANGKPVPKVRLYGRDGQELRAEQTVVKKNIRRKRDSPARA